MDTYINRIERFKEQDSKWSSNLFHSYGSFDDIKYELIEKYFDFKNTMDRKLMTSRIEGNTVSFFGNDRSLFAPLYTIDPKLCITEAKVLNPGTLYLKRQPKYKFRTYFKSRRMPVDFPKSIIDFIESYKTVKVSTGLERFVKSRINWNNFVYIHGSYFVEYDDESMITVLHMLFDKMVGRTYSLEKEP